MSIADRNEKDIYEIALLSDVSVRQKLTITLEGLLFLILPFSKTHLFVPHNLVLWCNKNGHMQELAVFLQFKRVFRSGHFLSYKVPPELRISRVTFKKYISRFIKLGWCSAIGKGFRLKSIRKIRELLPTKFKKIFKLINGSKSTILTQLRGLVILQKIKHKLFVENCIRQSITYSKGRKIPSNIKRIAYNGIAEDVQLGTKGIGQSFGRSKATGFRVKKSLLLLGQMKSRYNKAILIKRNSNYRELEIIREENPNAFLMGGNIIKRVPHSICYREM